MAYYIDLFSPDTYAAFLASDRDISGFRERQQSLAARIRPGDKLVCYLTKLSRWAGVLEVVSGPSLDETPIFTRPVDPFVVRFRVSPLVCLTPETAIPIRDDICWKHLSFTKDAHRNSHTWTGKLRNSLQRLSDEDGAYLEELLTAQQASPRDYPLTDADRKALRPVVVNSESGQIVVSVPDGGEAEQGGRASASEHIAMQATLAEIGDQMGFKIWLPRGDRQKVLEQWTPSADGVLVHQLPLNYNDATLRIIENIDVLWLRRKAIVHAFEVEHTTSIYSGLLRMADLMALQPNLSIKAHIVAPADRRAKVFREITRPVFSLMEHGQMSESCTFFSYDSVKELRGERNLQHMNESVLEEYVEYAEDADF